MKISNRGLDLIKAQEGYGKALPDGRCIAYQEKINGKLDVPTIGWGCTLGVSMGMIWTREEAEAALRTELEPHEHYVTRMVTAEISQNQFDALMSLAYNIGDAALRRSTVLKKLNAGDYKGAAEAFMLFDKFNGSVSSGLHARRAAERALFLEPMGEVSTAYMPQAAEERMTKEQRTLIGGGAVVASVEGARAVVDQGQAIKGVAQDAAALAAPALGLPLPFIVAGCVCLGLLALILVAHRRQS